MMTQSGLATCRRVVPRWPGCPPTFKLDFVLSERVRLTLCHGRSSDGGSEESDTTSKAGGLVNVTTSKVVELNYVDL